MRPTATVLLTAHLLGSSLLLAAACPAAERPMVCGEPRAMADLYWNGGMTDRAGNRWDVAFLPGVAPTAAITRDSWRRGITCIANTGAPNMGEHNLAHDAMHVAVHDIGHDFVAVGIHDDFVSTTHQVHGLWTDTPFGWIPQLVGRTFWGYVAKPTGRLIGGAVSATGAATIGVLAGSIEGTGRTVYAVGDIVTVGTVYPIGRLAWLQPSWLLSIINREPAPSQDGHWGLSIVHPATPPAVAADHG